MRTVTVKSLDRYRQKITTSKHTIISDEPEPTGDGAGPSPYELLLASLGSWIAITFRLYADRKGWHLRSTTIEMTHDRVKADDCPECPETGDMLVDVIRSHITVEGDLDEAQKQRLLEIAKRCPVHRTLEGGPTMVNKLEVLVPQKGT